MPSSTPSNFKPGESWNIDTATVSVDGAAQAKYFMLFTGSTTSYRKVYFSPTKSAGAHMIKQHVNYIERMTDRKVKRLHLDNGPEFTKSRDWAEAQGIEWIATTPHNSISNGRAEVSNKLVTTMSRKMLSHSGLITS